ncbi:GTP-binding protein LepA [Batrachochytrium salamandrivorans]|nr:GTP-binding protein LepA [Batrachochytrium salamandrivorans]
MARRLLSTNTERILKACREVSREDVRNFSVVGHIDSGKSSLSDKIMVMAGNLTAAEIEQGRVLDKLDVERSRGITVKSQSVAMKWKTNLLNLVDTPGHVDFSYEVRRSLSTCDGAILLVDSTQGVQAQTLANFTLAKSANLVIIPALTKLDLRTSDPDGSLKQMESFFGIKEDEVIWTSSKTGEGVDDLLNAVVARVPCPGLVPTNELLQQALGGEVPVRGAVVDLWYDQYRGVVVLMCVQRGTLRTADRVCILGEDGYPLENSSFEVKETGVFLPSQQKLDFGLETGRIGYVLSVNSKGAKAAFIGATIVSEREAKLIIQNAKSSSHLAVAKSNAVPVRPKATVFASCYPIDASDFEELKKAMNRLALNDASVIIKPETSTALGSGFRCGFLGQLHLEVFTQRLEDEFGTSLISTAPSVSYEVLLKDGTSYLAETPAQLPDQMFTVDHILEPMVRCTLLTPHEYVHAISTELVERRGVQESSDPIGDSNRFQLVYRLPWSEAVTDFQDTIKGMSSGFASFDLVECPAEAADIVRVDILLNSIKAEPLAFVCHRTQAERRGREVAKRLKDVIPSQQFDVSIQAAIGVKIVAREQLRGMKKNVLERSGKLVGGGDVTRKKKLLEQQKAGKERLKNVGNVQLTQEAFRAVLDRRGK